MNETITQLAKQAEAAYIPRYDMWQMDTETLEKFTELIVKECAEVAHCNFHVSGISLGVILKEHFGVEE